ncbi:AAA family ATPase [Nocardia sp. NPDC005998]|uniref:ATP-binding protein n=1 Tax=Nocardia sp. NPDC005998 TaxID=3156894 RepID=UPI0033BD8122
MSLEPDLFDVGIPTTNDGFVGRERELERIVAVLANAARMVTLVGPGGVGKTRLAAAVTTRLRKARRLQVHWVHLARLRPNADANAVEDEIVTAMIDSDFSGRTRRQVLIDTIGRTHTVGRVRPSVLVLDNCEHVLDAVGEVVAELLDAIPGLVVLATSRTAIGWVDEQVVTIPPLSRGQAVALFQQRAELAGRPVSAAEAELVEPICRHMHNYPLHIRLAAARLRYQTVSMILRDLDTFHADRRLRWSPGFRVGRDERHRDISTVIGWSYELCSRKERLLFERMSVFAAGYDIHPDDTDTAGAAVLDAGVSLETIEAVCADTEPDGLGAREIEALLEQLVDRSLVALHVGAETARYSLLESFRVFAHERLLERSESEYRLLTEHHRRYYRDEVAALCTGWVSSREQELLARTRASWDNVAIAVSGSMGHPDEAVIGAEIAAGLIASRVPFIRGSLRESRRLAESSLAAAVQQGCCPTDLEVRARALIGWISLCQGLPEDAERLLEECVAVCVVPTEGVRWRDDPCADLGLPPSVEYLAGSLLLLVHSDPRATVLLARARAKFTAEGDFGGASMAGLFEALSAAFHGTAEQALSRTRRHLDCSVAAGAQWAISWARLACAIAVAAHGDANEALALCDAGLAFQIPMRDQWGSVWGVEIRAWILARMITDQTDEVTRDQTVQRARVIARMAGGTAALRQQVGIDLSNLGPFEQMTVEAIEVARDILGHKAFESAHREGEQISDVALLVEEHVTVNIRPAARMDIEHGGSAGWDELTGAEQEVAVLAAAGLTNTTIATRRRTSARTVDSQIAAILSKLMINSRKDILALLPLVERDHADREAEQGRPVHVEAVQRWRH